MNVAMGIWPLEKIFGGVSKYPHDVCTWNRRDEPLAKILAGENFVVYSITYVECLGLLYL